MTYAQMYKKNFHQGTVTTQLTHGGKCSNRFMCKWIPKEWRNFLHIFTQLLPK